MGLLTYFSKLLKKTIRVEPDGWESVVEGGDLLVINKNGINNWSVIARKPISFLKNEKKTFYKNQDLRKNLKNLLIKELREISKDLNIPVRSTDTNKLLTKNQLKQEIIRFVYGD